MKNLNQICNVMRRDILDMVYGAGSGHIGGSLSAVEILAVLYLGGVMKYDTSKGVTERDNFILSKGHVTPVLYSALSHAGYFDRELLKTFRKFGSPLQGHPHAKYLKGIDSSSGSLGQGLSIACGLALGYRFQEKNNKVFCLVGDGELQEGQLWEAMMTAAHHKLDNLTLIIDHNKVQLDGTVDEVKSLGDLKLKIQAFGFNVIECDGHNVDELKAAFEKAKDTKGVPTAIIADTIKGKGISFMEGKAYWHGNLPNEKEYEAAKKELEIGGESL